MSIRTMKRADVDLGACPNCGNISLDGSSFDSDGGEVSQNLSCADCSATWTDVFEIIRRVLDVVGDDGRVIAVDKVYFNNE